MMETSQLIARLDRLERDNRTLARRCRYLWAACAVAMALPFLGAAMRFEEQEIFLRDPNNNNLRIAIGTDPKTGSAGLSIHNTSGNRLIFLGTSDAGAPELSFQAADGRTLQRIAP